MSKHLRLNELVSAAAMKGRFMIPGSGLEFPLKDDSGNLSLLLVEISKYPGAKPRQILDNREDMKSVLNGLVRPYLPAKYCIADWMPSIYTSVMFFNGNDLNPGKNGISMSVHFEMFNQNMFSYISADRLMKLSMGAEKYLGFDLATRIRKGEMDYVYQILTSKSQNMETAQWTGEFLEELAISFLSARLPEQIRIYRDIHWSNPLRKNGRGHQLDAVLAYYGRGINKIKNTLADEHVTVA